MSADLDNAEGAPRVVAVSGFCGRLLPGEGELPLRELVEAALENSPDATLDIEVLNDELRAMPAADAAMRLAESARVWRASLE